MLVGDLLRFRRLAPAYALHGTVFCWECTLCHKLFMLVPPETMPGHAELDQIQSEYEHHDCAIHFAITRYGRPQSGTKM
jgi:hypothetical protein